MASGAYHYQRAEGLMRQAAESSTKDFKNYAPAVAARQANAAEAQVHATLALAAATAMAHLEEMDANGSEFYEADDMAADEWAKAVRS